jgi:hypothetical protein
MRREKLRESNRAKVTEEKNEHQDIGYLIGQSLQTRALGEQLVFNADDHLDADTVTAFVEGRVAEPGATMITSHLIVCSSCRRATAQTIHLEGAVAAEDDRFGAESPPRSLRQFLDELAARVFPSSEEVVFAYQDQSVPPEPAEDEVTGEGSSESDNKNEK